MIDTLDKFKTAQQTHLDNLTAIRYFILGDENNQPQVTYYPKMSEFDKLLAEVQEWVETSNFEDYEE